MAVMRSGVLVWRGRGRERREGRGEEYKTCLGVYPYRMFVLRWPWLAKLGTRHPSPLPPPQRLEGPHKIRRLRYIDQQIVYIYNRERMASIGLL